MDIVGLVGAILGSGFISAILTYRLSNKKTDQDGFKILFEKLEEDNLRLREKEAKNETEIRELRKRVDEMQLKLQLMESAHNDLPIPQWLKDTHGRMLSINDPYIETFGKTREEYVGSTDWDVWPEAIARAFSNNDKEVMRKRKALHRTETILMPDGKEQEWYILKYPRFAGNVIIGIGGIAFKPIA